MIRNYFIIAWRNLVRNKVFSMINITGLAMGIGCCLLIMLWVQDERSKDGFHLNGKYLFQVYERQYYDGKVEAGYPTQGLLAEELKRIIPEIQYASSFEHASAAGTFSTLEAASKIVKLNGAFAGNDFLKMFTYPLLSGNAGDALNTNEAIAVSDKIASLFFGSADSAVGKIIRYENKEDLVVTAVFNTPPTTSSQQFDFLRSWTAYVKQNKWVYNWGNTSPETFIQLRPGADADKVEYKIRNFIYRYQPKDGSFVTELALQPYTNRYLHSTFKDGRIEGGRIEYVRLFTIVAFFILLIACINFMNLSTARSVDRAKEVGVRKVVGALQWVLFRQFVGEAMVVTLLSAFIGVGLAEFLLPAFNLLAAKQLSIPVTQPIFWAALSCLIITTGFIAGSYPALFLSSIKPVRILKSAFRFSRQSLLFRKSLVVFQFTLAIILMVGMIVIYRQMQYVQSKNLGYDRSNLLYLPLEGDLIKNYPFFKEEAGKVPGILSISKMRNSPTVIEHHTNSIAWAGKDPNVSVSFADAVVGFDFVKTMNLKVKDGRDFSKEFGTDSTGYILNETAVAKIGFKEPVGQTIVWGNHPGKIIGVIKDFHFSSMHVAIDPLIIRLDENWNWGTVLIRIQRGKTREALLRLEKLCKELNPKFPFSYQFSDEAFSSLYQSEQVVGKLSIYFSILAIFISCLGLFGLATFTASQRTKEIGVRRVLGASVSNIVSMLTTNFLIPVAIAMLFAIPVSGYVMNNWLQGFAYHVNTEWWIFVAACLTAIVIAMITVSFQAIQAAVAKPVKSLRTE